jgi:hypothetical protein
MLNRYSNVRLLLAATVLAAAACQDATEPTAPGITRGEVSLQQVPAQAQIPDQAQLALSIKGFGGLFLDRDGAPNVYLTDPQQRGEVERALTAFAREQGMSPSDIRVLRGNFDYLQLDDWFKAATENALAVDGALFTDLDEANNRVLIGVQSAAAIGRVQAALRSSNIPSDAVSIEVREPIIAEATLQDRVRPIVAGVQIHFGNYLCTLGFNAKDGTEDSFITASHCTNRQGGVEGTIYYQPLSSVDNTVVATEVEDPIYFKGGECPKGRKCRYSDAARAKYSSGFTSFTLGAIAKTSGANNGSLTITGTLSITGQNTNGNYTVGSIVSKVGRTTGWTSGRVSNTCVNTGVQGSNIVLLCQTFVDAGVGAGDSGSGVFSGNSSVTLEGILWGGNSSGSMFVFSPFANIQQELGTLTVH